MTWRDNRYTGPLDTSVKLPLETGQAGGAHVTPDQLLPKLTAGTGLSLSNGVMSLPPATESQLGGVKISAGLLVGGDGTLSVDATAVKDVPTTLGGTAPTAAQIAESKVVLYQPTAGQDFGATVAQLIGGSELSAMFLSNLLSTVPSGSYVPLILPNGGGYAAVPVSAFAGSSGASSSGGSGSSGSTSGSTGTGSGTSTGFGSTDGSTGGGNYPALTLSGATFAAGKFGRALSGGSGQVDLIVPSGGSITMRGWARFTSASLNAYNPFLWLSSGSDRFGWVFNDSFDVMTGGAIGHTYQNPRNGADHYLQITITNGNFVAYVDGNSVFTAGVTMPAAGSTITLHADMKQLASGDLLDDLVITASAASAVPTAAATRDASTVVIYPLDDNGNAS